MLKKRTYLQIAKLLPSNLQGSGSDDVTVEVEIENIPPKADAGV
jgi:hypothetical protein